MTLTRKTAREVSGMDKEKEGVLGTIVDTAKTGIRGWSPWQAVAAATYGQYQIGPA